VAWVQNGKEYWFTTREKFEKGIEEGKFLEYAYVHSNIYGTSLKVLPPAGPAPACCGEECPFLRVAGTG